MPAGKGDALMLMLDAPPPKGGGAGSSMSMQDVEPEEDLDDFDEDLDEGLEEDGPSLAFSTYAETALSTENTDQVEALRQAILTLKDEGLI